MMGEPDLSGHRILVVEEDYYIATDTARALQGAGADVIGPCPSEEAAQAEIEGRRPSAAVVDTNLGEGPTFDLARILKDKGVPFVFTTGYDKDVIPHEFDGVSRLEKPIALRRIVGAVAEVLGLA
jgi:DNA-binding response OmpR family regulator